MTMLTNYAYYPDTPTAFEHLDRFEISTNRGDYYGSRVLGYVLPPISGAYVFWIAADDVAELWLSTDEHPGNKQRIAAVSSAVAPRNWIAQTGQRSAAIPLVADQRYYIEALHRESTGSDHLAVGWQLPDGTLERPIPGSRLALFRPAARLYAEEAVSVNEGNTGVTDLAIQLRLVTSRSDTFTIAFATSNGTASAGNDYLATNGTMIFGPGQTNQTLHFGIIGDNMDEANETFIVNLTTMDGLTLMSTRSRVSIIDDDEPPALSIDDVALTEGDAGLTDADFTVSLSAPSAFLVHARYATANSTAQSGADYMATNGVLSFPPGTTNQTVLVRVLGDTLIESNETFFVRLSSSSNATIDRSQGVGTILDDDFKVTAIQQVGSDIRLRFTTAVGASYRLERATSLVAPIDWNAIPSAAHVPGTGALVEVIDPGGGVSAQRFYRIVTN